ncbi:spore protease YyaC [Paenibacillus sp. 1011MAR3C5]|uniref:spore protease YyaC n=1 Tax=Paenibacillus sp. 1011MAR3C5 TaxID=1675787 RepID=UPI0021757CF8|nr:spore protease YyaC [Paenibacillus sp. 1011MAR3C5]
MKNQVRMMEQSTGSDAARGSRSRMKRKEAETDIQAAWDAAGLAEFLAMVARKEPDPDRIMFICIGSDRSTGDAFGPLLGMLLKEQGWKHVIGTLEEPCDAHAVESAVSRAAVLQDSGRLTVIAVDACLGKPQSVGGFITREGPLQPGAATGRRLPAVGDYSIAGVVNLNGVKAYGMLQTTSLHLVMDMAKQAAAAIREAWLAKGNNG